MNFIFQPTCFYCQSSKADLMYKTFRVCRSCFDIQIAKDKNLEEFEKNKWRFCPEKKCWRKKCQADLTYSYPNEKEVTSCAVCHKSFVD